MIGYILTKMIKLSISIIVLSIMVYHYDDMHYPHKAVTRSICEFRLLFDMSGDVYSFSDKFLSVNSIANIENAVNLVSRTKPEYLIINYLLEDKKRVDHFVFPADEFLEINRNREDRSERLETFLERSRYKSASTVKMRIQAILTWQSESRA